MTVGQLAVREKLDKNCFFIEILMVYGFCMQILLFLLGMQILRGSPVKPGGQTHAMSCCWAVQSAFMPQLEIKHASTQVPVWQTSL